MNDIVDNFRMLVDCLQAYNGAVTAVATVSIAVFTVVLAFVTGKQARLTREAIELSNKEFMATHRARIFVHSAKVTDKGTSRTNPFSMPDDTKLAKATFTIVNGGESDVTLIEWKAVIYIQTAEAAFTPKLGTPQTRKLVLAPGENVSIDHTQPPVDIEWHDFVHEGARVFLIGEIAYEGPDKVRRNTGFCREYSKETGMYHALEKSEYEYAY